MAGIDVDVSAFLLKGDGKLRNDDDMCFYGQPSVAAGSVALASSDNGRTEFRIDLGPIDGMIETAASTRTMK